MCRDCWLVRSSASVGGEPRLCIPKTTPVRLWGANSAHANVGCGFRAAVDRLRPSRASAPRVFPVRGPVRGEQQRAKGSARALADYLADAIDMLFAAAARDGRLAAVQRVTCGDLLDGSSGLQQRSTSGSRCVPFFGGDGWLGTSLRCPNGIDGDSSGSRLGALPGSSARTATGLGSGVSADRRPAGVDSSRKAFP